MEPEVEAPAEQVDTPTEAAPVEGALETQVETPEPSTDWEKRYKDVQGSYTRSQQELAQVKQQLAAFGALQSDDPAELAALLEQYGWQLPQTADTEEPDPHQQMLSEWEQFKATQAEQQHQAQLDALERTIEQGIEQEAKAAGLTLTDRSRNLIFNNVLASPPGEDGQPNVKQALADYVAERDDIIKGYRTTKAEVPQPPVTGQPGTPSVPLGDAKARRNLALEVANQAYGGSS